MCTVMKRERQTNGEEFQLGVKDEQGQMLRKVCTCLSCSKDVRVSQKAWPMRAK